jgi:hypothetical protein
MRESRNINQSRAPVNDMQPLLKVLVSALLIVSISEVSKRSSLLGALLASLPLVSILAMIWLYRDTHDVVRVARFSTGVFWLVLPSLVMFAVLPPLLLRWRLSFAAALAIACLATALAYVAMSAVLKKMGVSI